MTIDIAKARAVIYAATPGPWEWDDDRMYGHEMVSIAYEDGEYINPVLTSGDWRKP